MVCWVLERFFRFLLHFVLTDGIAIEDDWSNDDDSGFFIITITTDEFFELEEVRCLTASLTLPKNFSQGMFGNGI